ncbi:MAG: NUDIX hydrolase [Gammaproteobacteria bacterium]
MSHSNRKLIAGVAALTVVAGNVAAETQGVAEKAGGYWTAEQADAILQKTLRVHLAPSLNGLSVEERTALQKLLAVGQIMQRLYEESRHPQALAAHDELLRVTGTELDPGRGQMLRDLYRLSSGPIITSLDNRRLPFLPVADETPGKNVYPAGIGRDEIDRLLAQHPELQPELMHLRYVVRRNQPGTIQRDLQALKRHPVLAVLHPGLTDELIHAQANPAEHSLYAIPYSVAYADDLMRAYKLLFDAAQALGQSDPAFSRYLRNRARDLLADDYEAGDAAWVTGHFKNLNAQIGSYETYDDQLYGVKTFFGLSVLIRDPERSAELAAATQGLQAIEDSLPYESTRRIREDIPVGVYTVVADFGQARGANTASILPNEAYLTRQYGRTILLRGNILTNARLFEVARASFEAAIDVRHHADLTAEGSLQRTLWHEIGHYLGVDLTRDGRDLDEALQDASDLYEEMKADLVSLFAVRQLTTRGYYTPDQARAVYAAGILRVLQKTEPRRTQPYQTMQLMQWNWLLEQGVLTFNSRNQTMDIHYDRYHDAVGKLLAEVLSIQSEGNRERAESFVKRYTAWDPALHGVVAGRMQAQETYRYALLTYEAIGDPPPVAVP